MLSSFEGVICAMVTPFAPNEEVDESGLRNHIEFLLSAGVHGLLFLGGCGEFMNLDVDERQRVMEIAIDQTRGRVPAIVGALSPSTPEVCAMACRAGRAGADAVMVLPPYYVTPSAAAVETHYRRVADEAGLPIVVYNNPARTHVSLDAAMLLKLAEINEVIAVKECDRDFTSLLDKIQKVGGRIRILSGEDDLAFPTLMLGAKGGIWATSNLFPEIFVSMYQAVAAGHLERARRFHHQLLPLWKAVFVPNHPAPLKEAMALASRPVGKARSPLASTEEQVANVRSALEAVSLYGH